MQLNKKTDSLYAIHSVTKLSFPKPTMMPIFVDAAKLQNTIQYTI